MSDIWSRKGKRLLIVLLLIANNLGKTELLNSYLNFFSLFFYLYSIFSSYFIVFIFSLKTILFQAEDVEQILLHNG